MSILTSGIVANQARHDKNLKQLEVVYNQKMLDACLTRISYLKEQTEAGKEAMSVIEDRAGATSKAKKVDLYNSNGSYKDACDVVSYSEHLTKEMEVNQKLYETKKDSLNDELTLLEQEMKAFEEDHQKSATNATKLWCFGG